MAMFSDTQAALDTVEAVIAANAQMLGEEPAIHAGVIAGQIALFRNGEDRPARILGTPEHAVFFAQRAFLKCAEKTRGGISL